MLCSHLRTIVGYMGGTRGDLILNFMKAPELYDEHFWRLEVRNACQNTCCEFGAPAGFMSVAYFLTWQCCTGGGEQEISSS